MYNQVTLDKCVGGLILVPLSFWKGKIISSDVTFLDALSVFRRYLFKNCFYFLRKQIKFTKVNGVVIRLL